MAEEKLKIQAISEKDNTFFVIPKGELKDKIEKEIGDSKTKGEFLPQQKIQRWDNECNVSLRLVHKEKKPRVMQEEGKVKWKGSRVEAHFYDIESEDHPEGASEFEILLLEKPETNKVEFTVVDKDVDYFYQPEIEDREIEGFEKLTPEELLAKKREMRPENVVGSYAVYAKTPKTNWKGGKEYKTGKVGHIYRPQVEDSAGNKVWGELHIENGILSVTIPQDFLDNAVYPVRHAAGLTFGYTTAGASYQTGGTNCMVYRFTTPSDIGDVVSMTCHVRQIYAGGYGKYVLWTAPDGVVVANGASENTVSLTFPRQWRTADVPIAPNLSPSTDYFMGAIGNTSGNSLEWNYDSGGTAGYSWSNITNSLSSPTNLSFPSAFYNNDSIRSIYATYTAGGGATAPTVTTQAVSSITQTTATGNGNVTADGGATVTERGVCWGTSTNPTIAGSHASAAAGGTGAFTASITGLSASTHYYVRAYATNSEGTSYGDNVEFDTLSAGGDFVIAGESSTSSIENISLQFQGNFQISNEESASSIESIEIERNGGDFTVAGEESASSIENIALIGNLKIDDQESASSLENLDIERNGGDFTLADLASLTSIENISIQQSGSLLTADIETVSIIDNIALEQGGGTLTVNNEESETEIDNIALIGNLKIDDESSVSSIGALVLERNGGDFVVANESSESSIENIKLIGDFVIDDESCESYAENVEIERNGGDFTVDEIISASSADNIAIQQSGTLLVSDVENVSSIDNVAIEQNGGVLEMQGIACAPEIENVGLEGNFIIEGIVCESVSEEIELEFSGATFAIASITSNAENEHIDLIGEFIIQDINAPPTIGNIAITSPAMSTMNKNVFITQGGLALQTGGLRIPTCTSAERPTALKGSLIYNTELNSLEIHDGSNWTTV